MGKSYRQLSILKKNRDPGASVGFTLIELIFVMGIIGILVSMAILIAAAYIEKAKIATARADIDRIHKAVALLETDTGEWPGHQTPGVHVGGGNEIWDLTAPSAGLLATDGSFPNWRGPYLDSIPADPWGNNYFFDSDYLVTGQNRAAIGSFGPNKVGPNVYDSDDVIEIIL